MRTWSFPSLLALVCGTLLCGSLSAAAQSEPTFTPHHFIFGYQDAQTGVFHPTPHAIPDGSSDPVISGQIWLTINVTLTTPVPSGYLVGCEADARVSASETTPPYTSTAYDELGYAIATVSGSTATCLIKIPYSWTFPSTTSTTNSLTGSYIVEIVSPATNAAPPVIRTSSSDFLSSTTIPANGTKSTYTVNARL